MSCSYFSIESPSRSGGGWEEKKEKDKEGKRSHREKRERKRRNREVVFEIVVQSLSHVQLFATPWTAA